MKKLSFSLTAFLVLNLIVGCANTDPIVVEVGQERCAHCRMDIADMRFNTQLITKKGKRYHFDSIECMVSWIKDHPEQPMAKAYVKNFYKSKEYVDYSEAKFLKSEKLPSPMGAFLSSYSSDDEISKAIAEYGGNELDQTQLNDLVNHWSSRMKTSHGDKK